MPGALATTLVYRLCGLPRISFAMMQAFHCIRSPCAGEPPMELQVPASINKFLRSYQRDGIRFLFRQYALNMGGILADDMGLGKTVQTIGFLAAVLGKTGTDADLQPALHQTDRYESSHALALRPCSCSLQCSKRHHGSWHGPGQDCADHGASLLLCWARQGPLQACSLPFIRQTGAEASMHRACMMLTTSSLSTEVCRQ